MNAVVLVVDRLHAGYLGCYGNTWVGTPQLDRLAAESLVFDCALLDRPGIEPYYRACWTGLHAAQQGNSLPLNLLQQLSGCGVHIVCVTDEPLVLPLLPEAVEVVQLPAGDARGPARSAAETQFSAALAAATEQLAALCEPFLFWVHLQGMAAPWDAPYELRARYAEPDEPSPPRTVCVPRLTLAPDSDPDLILGFSQAYAGQVALLDACLGAFTEAIRAAPWAERTLVVLTSLRGMPLGEHGLLGPFDTPLACELVHLPLLLRFPDGAGFLARSHALVQPPDLAATLRAWWDLHASSGWGQSLLRLAADEGEPIRDRAFLHDGQSEWAVRTAHWYLRRRSAEQEPRYTLYVKPDDRWERNDVADRCPDVVEALDAALNEFLASSTEPGMKLTSPLPGPAD